MSKTFQVDKLLGFMQEEPSRQWMAKDFQNHPRFIGYEAGPRLCDLCEEGFAVRVGRQGRFMLYALTEKGRKFRSVDEARKEQTASVTTAAEDPSKTRDRDDFPDEVQESPTMDAVAYHIQASMMTPIGDLQKADKYTHRIAYKGGFIDPGTMPSGVYRLFGMDPGYDHGSQVSHIEVQGGKVTEVIDFSMVLVLALYDAARLRRRLVG